MALDASGKEIKIGHVKGPVVAQARNFDKSKINSLGWEADTSLDEGIAPTYGWIKEPVEIWQGHGS